MKSDPSCPLGAADEIFSSKKNVVTLEIDENDSKNYHITPHFSTILFRQSS